MGRLNTTANPFSGYDTFPKQNPFSVDLERPFAVRLNTHPLRVWARRDLCGPCRKRSNRSWDAVQRCVIRAVFSGLIDKASDVVSDSKKETDLGGTNYEVIQQRLSALGNTLDDKIKALNDKRLELFDSPEMEPIDRVRIRTQDSSVPRDIITIGDTLLFGFNVQKGMAKMELEDVLTLHTLQITQDGDKTKHTFLDLPKDDPRNFLQNPDFLRDFERLYNVYKKARLVQLRRVQPKNRPKLLLAVFQVGLKLTDVQVFRWQITADEKARYIDASGIEDNVLLPSHDFAWVPTTRNDHRTEGRHPHISILDEVFVETIGGDLTIKVEDNTEDGLGIYREPVDEQYQSLSDAEVLYKDLGALILLKIKPYREKEFRYFIFNTNTQTVERLDALGISCQQLPEQHGVIFPGGYYLQSGDLRILSDDVDGMQFQQTISSPNGEDVIYVYYAPETGHYSVLSYNMIRKEIRNNISCNGYCFFEDGRLSLFQAQEEATQNHYMQIWQTPYMSDNFAATLPPPGGDSFLSKIGNKDLVRGISEGYSITNAIQNQQPTVGIYEDLIERVKQMIKAYYWLDHKDTGNLQRELNTIQDTAELVLDEFHKVVALKKRAQEALQQTETHQEDLFTQFYGDWEDLDRFVQALSALRQQRGHLITLRDMRYIDAERIAILEAKVTDKIEELSQRTIQFLLKPEALDPYRTSIEEASERIDSIEKTTEVDEVRTRMAEISGGLDLLTEIVSSLDVDDPTARTSILQNIAAVMGLLNRSRALLEGHGKKLQESEGKAEFAAQFALFGQSVSSALATSDSPEKCDDNLSRLMVQLSELESRFSEFDVFFEQISAKQDEVREIFEARKQSLEDERQRRALNLQRAGERTVQNIIRRASSYDDLDALNAFFAGDSMVTKVRDTVERLRKLGDTVKADDLQSKLTTARDEATRTFRDKSDLYEDGNNIRLGNFLFSVNTQNFELTAIPRDGIMCLHLTGTDFFEPIDDAAFANTQAFWSQRLPSETEDVYRAEFLAATIFLDAQANRNGLSVDLLHEEYANENGFLPLVQRTAQDRYDEGYERGVHDADAALILEKLLALQSTTGNLRFSSHARAMAALFWAFGTERQQSALWSRRGQSLGRLRSTFQSSQALETFGRELSSSIQTFLETHNLLRTLSPDPAKDGPLLEEAGVYLAEELTKERPQFTISGAAQRLRDHFFSHLDKERARRHFEDDLRTFENDPSSLFHIAHSWLDAYAQSAPDDENVDDEQRSSVLEATILTLTKGHIDHSVSSALTSIDVQGLIGQHPRVRDNTLPLQLDTFTARLNDFIHNRVPAFNAYRRHLQEVLTSARERLRLDSIKPGILSSFVRNKLIQEVYFKIIGDNFSKQLGAEGENKRSDRQGLLLLISPPGYGKTTLMEYVANRLGLVFMKINGPALGHDTVSLDPAEAPNATARQEVNRLNMALEMGNNVMLYLDDIQHTHPEFLQKFISLCDGQRKIEGVWRGKTKTYDLRGKRFCVVMAGNPYTETGEAFQIPDMLANRADTYNLGDVLGGREDVFSLSYVENALVSNPTLAPLSNRDQNDTYALIRLAEGKEISPDDLSYAYPQQEIREITSVLQHLFTVRDVLFDVNATYIASAATDDDYRTEPPFKLQGSYRNMAKIAEKITPVHNHEEVEAIIDDHYRGEAQTLTIAAEANLLKLASLRDRMTPEEQERWHTICSEYQRRQVMGGGQNDPVARIAAPLGSLVQQLTEMQRSLSSNTLAPQLTAVGTSLQNIEQSLSANPLPTHLNTLNTSLQGIASSLQRDSLSPSLESLTEHLSLIAESIQNDRSLSSHLAGMRQTMQAIVQHLKTPPQPTTPTPQPTPQADLFAPLLESLQTSLQTMGTSIAEATTAAAQAANAATQTAERHIALPTAPPQPTTPTPTQNPTTPTQPGSFAQPEIRIVNEAPDNIRDVLTHQIEVLEWTLVPLVRTMTQNLQFSSESWTKLSEVLERVKQLNTHFNQGTPHISTTPPTSSPPPANYHHPNTQRPPQRSNLRPAPQRSTPAAPQHQHAPTHTRTPQPQHSPTPHQQRRSPHTTSAHPQPASTPHQHAGPSPYTQRPGPNVQRPSQARSAQHSTTYNAPPQPSQSSHQSTPANTHLRYPPPKRRPPTVYIPPNAKTNRSGSTQELPAIPKKPKKPE